MKKITIIAILLLFVLHSKAQNIVPVEKTINYKIAHKGIPTGTYLKDVNNLFAPYIGTWKGTINNKTYTFFITKKTETSYGSSSDQLIIHHLIVDNMGSTLEDTRLSKSGPDITGWFFTEDLKYYCLNYTGGENWACGRNGRVFIKKVNATTMSLKLSAYGEVIDIKRCPGGKMAEQILPTETPVTLVKQ